MDISTARKAMEATVTLLGQISIPMALFDQVGKPIRDAMNNMLIGLDAIKEEPEFVSAEVLKDGDPDVG